MLEPIDQLFFFPLFSTSSTISFHFFPFLREMDDVVDEMIISSREEMINGGGIK